MSKYSDSCYPFLILGEARRFMKNNLSVEINHIKGINNLKINMPLKPDVYAITGINGIGKSTLLSCITPRLKRPISFTPLSLLSEEGAFIKYILDETEETWTLENGEWQCNSEVTLPLRGFQEGSLTNGTRFFNISAFGFRYYHKLLKGNFDLLVEADDFVKKNLGKILQNDEDYYCDLFRLDRSKAEKYYKYKGVVYYLKIRDKLVSQFELSTGEFLLINLLHLFNNLLIRTNNVEKLNLILIDEIELALHPSAIKRLVELTRSIAKKYNVAIYFSTHSLEIINSLPIENLFYLHQISKDSIRCETPCYPAYITRDIYTHSGYDVLILVEDDLAKFLVNRFVEKNRLDYNKRIQIIPVGGYDNTLELHQNFLQEEVLQPVSHIISIIDGDVEKTVAQKREKEGKWTGIPKDSILFLPIESLEKYLKSELFDNKNYDLMRLLRDRLFKFETDTNWFMKPYKENIESKKQDDIKKGKAPQDDSKYFANGKNLFSILSEKYESQGHSRTEFREKISQIVIDYLDPKTFEEQLGKALSAIFKS